MLDATNRTLALADITLDLLGRYEVEVGNSAGTVTSDPAWLLLAARWTELVVCDDRGADTAGIRSQIQ